MKLQVKKEFKEIIPPLSDAEFEQLELNCLQDGILDSIKQWNGYVIDGHNRFEIANKHNLLYDIHNFHFNNESEAEQWIVNNQLGRRNLTEEQREYLIGKRYKIDKKAHGGNEFVEKGRSEPSVQNVHSVKTADKIAVEYNINPLTVRRAEKYTEAIDNISENLGDNIKKEILSGNLKTNKKDVIEIGNYEPEQQKIVIEKMQTGKSSADVLKDIQKEKRMQEIEAVKQQIETENLTINNKYDVIVIDPPWQYNREYDPNSSRVASPYPEMSFEEIANIELPTKDNCFLWLWTTHKFLPDAFELLKIWNFDYKTTIVWDKEKIGMGRWFRMQCEFCLFAIKGNPVWHNTIERDIIRETRREHSRKPDTFYELVEKLTYGNKLDYFSRTNRKGWDSYGAETNKF